MVNIDSPQKPLDGPPVGDEMTRFVLEAKTAVLKQISTRPKRTKRLGLFTMSGIVLFGVGALTGGAFAGGLFPTKGSATITFPAPAFVASDMTVDFTCIGPGRYDLSVVGQSDSMHVECDGTNNVTGSMEVILDDPTAVHSVVVTTTNSAQYTVNARFTEKGPIAYPTNAKGQTYGVKPPDATNYPDLLFVAGTAPDGESVQGYVPFSDVTYPAELPPAEYQNWAATFHTQYPDGKPIPMVAADGETTVGTFIYYL